MCGIAGIVNFNNNSVAKSAIKNMMAAMKHRGPDDEGEFIENNIGLGFVRLSILDLSPSGHQPMFSDDDRYVITFNGEVYNYLEIREILKAKHEFKSNTDTEVVLKAFIEWGESCLDKFNGMFAFVIYDRLAQTLFGARDRFGIKPFYYQYNTNQFIFASDIPPILTNQNVIVSPNEEVIFNYLLTNRTNYSEQTFFNNIIKLKPGFQLKLNKTDLTVEQWYDIDDHKKKRRIYQ
jgi:asparagine synthase (glutamine-hydrolysing)